MKKIKYRHPKQCPECRELLGVDTRMTCENGTYKKHWYCWNCGFRYTTVDCTFRVLVDDPNFISKYPETERHESFSGRSTQQQSWSY